MKYILAISGGIDSVVLLYMAARGKLFNPGAEFVVAHFDHGIRSESGNDAKFVYDLAVKYGMGHVIEHAKLGMNASEELARKERYEFLRRVKDEAKADKIVTAHHQDDLVETILINLIRGTGWRGLAPFWSDDICRPLVNMPKSELVMYAIKNNLEWTEDATNYSPKYLRNRVRGLMAKIPPSSYRKLLELYGLQKKLRSEIEEIIEIDGESSLHQDFVLSLPDEVAIELLRSWTSSKLTRPQLQRLLKFIKNAESGDICQPGASMQIGVYCGNMSLSCLIK